MSSLNILPQDYESANKRSLWDERIEMFGLSCRLYRAAAIGSGSRTYDRFDDLEIVGTTPTAINSFVILEPYQDPKDRAGDSQGSITETFPFLSCVRFVDNAMRGDIVEIDYQYAQNSGRTPDNNSGTASTPLVDLPTRFKLVNRQMTGIRSDFTNRFFITPTEESWHT